MYIPTILPVISEPSAGSKIPERDTAEEIYFHPASHNHAVKGNDILLKAFGKYIKEFRPSAKLVMVAWGDDIEASRRIVRDLSISGYVVFKEWLDKKTIRDYMKCADLIFDQFMMFWV